MLVEFAAGAFLLAGAVACAGAAVHGRRARGARVALALALATAGVGDLAGGTRWSTVAACALAAVAVALLVLARSGAVSRLSWLDAAMARPPPPAWSWCSAPARPGRSVPAGWPAASL